ncbi:hypothetical protein ES703_20196 [subsurface metagenome]
MITGPAYSGFQSFFSCLSKNSLRAVLTISLLLLYSPASIIWSIASRYSLLSLRVRVSCIFLDTLFNSVIVCLAVIMCMQYLGNTFLMPQQDILPKGRH